jgi:1-acyl-sn-glycerol-3-phosphate acyltransferase
MPFDGLGGRAAYLALYAVSFWSLTFGAGIRVRGRRHVPRKGPVLLVANHQSYLDPWFVSLAVAPLRLTHLARSNLFDGSRFEAAIRSLGAVPIDRNFGRDGLQAVLARLARGEAVLVFAEGERTHGGDVQPLKPGVSLLVKKSNVPVLPVGIAGAFDIWPRHAPLPIPNPLFLPDSGRSVAVSIGEAVPAGRYIKGDREPILADLGCRIRAEQAAAERLRRKPPRPLH